jgi:hypothetical protein
LYPRNEGPALSEKNHEPGGLGNLGRAPDAGVAVGRAPGGLPGWAGVNTLDDSANLTGVVINLLKEWKKWLQFIFSLIERYLPQTNRSRSTSSAMP